MIKFIYFLIIIVFIVPWKNSQAQDSKIDWYCFSSGFAYSWNDNTFLKSSVGQPLIGISSNSTNSTIAGFFSNSSLISIVSVNDEINGTYISINIHPNPANDFIEMSIVTDVQAMEKLELRIYNFQGQFIKDYKFELTNYEKQAKFDISNLPIGLYFIRLKNKSLPFIKN